MTAVKIRMIHVGARQLGLDAETRRDLQLLATGKASLTDMTEDELDRVVLALKERGFAPGQKPGKAGRPRAARGDVRYAHVLWGKLHRAGAVEAAGAKGLNAFIRSRFAASWGAAPIDIDRMNDFRQIATVIEALKAMCDRAGVSP